MCSGWGDSNSTSPASPAEVRQRARAILHGGADFIKVIATGAVLAPGTRPGVPELSEEEIRNMVSDAETHADEDRRARELAEVDLAAVPEAVGASRCEVDLRERRLLVWKVVCDFGRVRGRVLRGWRSAPAPVVDRPGRSGDRSACPPRLLSTRAPRRSAPGAQP